VEKLVQTLREKIDGVSKLFTLDACRHGGMTELKEAELTEGQGRALSGHKTAQAYRGYAKETMRRALAATRKRHAHLLAQKQLEEQSSTEFPNDGSTRTVARCRQLPRNWLRFIHPGAYRHENSQDCSHPSPWREFTNSPWTGLPEMSNLTEAR
jgi:hypothetical protein